MTEATIHLGDITHLINPPGPHDHKYSRGVVGLVVGSDDFPGAAVLATSAALHAGVGMARVLTDKSVQSLVLSSTPEAVLVPGNVDAVVVGSGIPEHAVDTAIERLHTLPITDSTPVIVDAGALTRARDIPGAKILTPHAGELDRLAESLGIVNTSSRESAVAVASSLGVVVYLKGSRSVICTPGDVAYELPEAPHWLASAGTGDVLAGIMGAVCAGQQGSLVDSNSLALWAAAAGLIHSAAAERASVRLGEGEPGPLLASELAREVSAVIARLVQS
jgi:hydroxyethylthiazole kinase-like uncharacterized protein yjeF